MAQTRPVIVLPPGKVKQLCDAEGVRKTKVYNALNYTTNNEDAVRIRRLAISTYGGVETRKPAFT